jgi:site-specific recombinase XerC
MTGLRQGELIALRWSDVDWQAQRIRVRRSHTLGEFDTPKSRRAVRSVPMSRRVAVALDACQTASDWSDDDDLVFAEPATGDVLRRGALMRRYRRALRAAKLPGTFRFHDLRPSFGTAMAAAGVPMRSLMAMMGHERLETTLIHADHAPNAHVVAIVDRAFEPLARDAIRDANLRTCKASKHGLPQSAPVASNGSSPVSPIARGPHMRAFRLWRRARGVRAHLLVARPRDGGRT